MKKVYLLLAILFIVTSCTKDDNHINNGYGTNYDNKLHYNDESNTITDKSSKWSKDEEKMLVSAISPIIEYGREIQHSILNSKYLYHPVYGLSEDDINYIKTMKDDELALLPIVLGAIVVDKESDDLDDTESQIIDPTIVRCISAALGIKDVINGIQLIIGGGGSVGTATGIKLGIRILRKVGSRFLGVIGIAMAVYDFIDCYTSFTMREEVRNYGPEIMIKEFGKELRIFTADLKTLINGKIKIEGDILAI